MSKNLSLDDTIKAFEWCTGGTSDKCRNCPLENERPEAFCKDALEENVLKYLNILRTANSNNLPPCNVGDTVYFVNSITLSHYTVTEIRYDGHLWYFNCENKNYDKAHRTFGFFESSINETIFLNKSDANAAYEREKI